MEGVKGWRRKKEETRKEKDDFWRGREGRQRRKIKRKEIQGGSERWKEGGLKSEKVGVEKTREDQGYNKWGKKRKYKKVKGEGRKKGLEVEKTRRKEENTERGKREMRKKK
jgi:hypothetical protein